MASGLVCPFNFISSKMLFVYSPESYTVVVTAVADFYLNYS